MTGRATAQVLRLATIYALLNSSNTIQLPHLHAALALWRYCEASCSYIFHRKLGNPIADAILPHLRSTTAGLSRTDISSIFANHKRHWEIEAALQWLLENGLAKRTYFKPELGRPTEIWTAVDSAKKAKDAK